MEGLIHVLLADDHQVIRQGLSLLLQMEPDIRIVGEAGDGETAIRLARELHPDVVVMDCRMPSLSGIDATRQITTCGGTSKVVGLSATADPGTACAMLRAGARGFVAKDEAADALITAVRTAAHGETYLSPSLAETVVTAGGPAAGPDGASTLTARLTPRQREVLQLIAEGKSTKDVAYHLKVSVKTVETHRRAMMELLHVDSIAELTKVAVREGLTSLEA
jgi:DNA-binding NarL/FixJ family response regulator